MSTYIAATVIVLISLCVLTFLEWHLRSADIRKMEEIKDEINSGCNMMVNASSLMVDYLKLKPKDRTNEILDAVKNIERRADIRMDWTVGSFVSVGGEWYEVTDVCRHSATGEADAVDVHAERTMAVCRLEEQLEEEGEKV